MARDNVSDLIAKYFKTIHEDIIWTTLAASKSKPAPNPDRLVAFEELLMKAYSASVRLFLDEPRPCDDPDDCRQTEKCVDGLCVPKEPPGFLLNDEEIRPCDDPDDCRQTEKCVDGICVPRMSELDPGLVSQPPVYTADLREVIETYFGRIHAVLVAGLGMKPRQIVPVRRLLCTLYADALALKGGGKLAQCEEPGDCPDGFVCINGRCVPVPFRLVFRKLGTPPGAPWK